MRNLDFAEVNEVSGGANQQFDIVDLFSTYIGMNACASFMHVFRPQTTSVYGLGLNVSLVVLAQISGAFIGYNIAQYFKDPD